MKHFYDLASIHQTAQKCKHEGIPISEKALRNFVKNGQLRAIMSGKKALVLWENVLNFVREGSGRSGV